MISSMLFPLSIDGGATEMADVVVVGKGCVPEVVPAVKLLKS